VLVPGFLILGDWQLRRALGGNGLSWAYTVEWPLFAGYAIFLWWKLLHEDDPKSIARARQRKNRRAVSPNADAELEAYNAYLASLHGSDARTSDSSS
jgi:hypothetical protein